MISELRHMTPTKISQKFPTKFLYTLKTRGQWLKSQCYRFLSTWFSLVFIEVIQINKMLVRGAGGWNVYQANYLSTLGPIPFSHRNTESFKLEKTFKIMIIHYDDCIIIPSLESGWWDRMHLSNFADDTKLGREINRPGGCFALQRDLARLEKWANRNLMSFKKREMSSPAPGRNHPKYQHRLGADWLESILAEKGCPYRYQADHETSIRAKQDLGCIRQSGASMLSGDCQFFKWRGSNKRNVFTFLLKEVTPFAWRRVWAVTCVHPRYLGIILNYQLSGS